jgi:hypothetical protein
MTSLLFEYPKFIKKPLFKIIPKFADNIGCLFIVVFIVVINLFCDFFI